MITDMISNKKLNQMLTELFIRGRKLSISTVFVTQSCFVEQNNAFYYENLKQMKASANPIESSIRSWLQKLLIYAKSVLQLTTMLLASYRQRNIIF